MDHQCIESGRRERNVRALHERAQMRGIELIETIVHMLNYAPDGIQAAHL
jgi:hypothetical protein